MTTALLINLFLGKGWPIVLWVIFLLLAAEYMFARNTSRGTSLFRYTACATIALFFLRALLLAYATYSLWLNAPPSIYLLPPYQPISYFLQYSFTHFFASFLLTSAVACAMSTILFFLNKRRSHLLVPGDLALVFTAVFLTAWPLAILYLGALFTGAVLLILSQRYIMKKEEQIIFGAHVLFWILPFFLFGNNLITFFNLQTLVMPF